jgi:hypothetical protein
VKEAGPADETPARENAKAAEKAPAAAPAVVNETPAKEDAKAAEAPNAAPAVVNETPAKEDAKAAAEAGAAPAVINETPAREGAKAAAEAGAALAVVNETPAREVLVEIQPVPQAIANETPAKEPAPVCKAALSRELSCAVVAESPELSKAVHVLEASPEMLPPAKRPKVKD